MVHPRRLSDNNRGAGAGGRIVAAGTSEEVAQVEQSCTEQYFTAIPEDAGACATPKAGGIIELNHV